MERYSEYKDSGVKWLGKIPSHWEVMPLKSFIKFEKGKTPKEFSDENIGLPYLTMDYLRSRDNKIVKYPTSSIGLFEIEESEALVLWDGANAGEFILSKKGYLGSTMAKISGYREYFNNLYFYYFLKMLEPTSKDFANGTTIPHFDASILINYHYPIPPIDEQIVIGSYLDAATSKIDKAIDMQQKMIDLLNERKQIIIQNAVTKGLDDKVEMKDSGVEWTEFFPNSWSIKKVKYIFEFISTKEVASNRTFNIALENIVAHSGNYIDTNSEYEAAGVSFRKNDILFGKLRPYLAKVHLCERAGIALGDIFVLRPLSGFDSSFLRYLLISERFIQYVDSSTYGAKMPRANWNFIGNIYVAYPTLDKQRDISKYLDKEMQRFDSAISNCQRKIALLQERKQIIINEVVTGKVKVS